MCVHGLRIPAGTARVRLQLLSRTRERPQLKLALTLASASVQTSSAARSSGRTRPVESEIAPTPVGVSRVSAAVFSVPQLADLHGEQMASLCVRSGDLVNWAGTPLPAVPASDPATVAGRPVGGRIAVWYLPGSGEQRSYLAGLGSILRRASLFRPGFVGPWLYVLLLFVLLPLLALAAVRCLALAASGSASRKIGLALFIIAALNFACWALITPPFQAPDEVDRPANARHRRTQGASRAHDIQHRQAAILVIRLLASQCHARDCPPCSLR